VQEGVDPVDIGIDQIGTLTNPVLLREAPVWALT